MDCRHLRFHLHPKSLQGIEFSQTDLEHLRSLLQVTAFWAQERRIEDLAVAIAHSYPVVTVWDREQLIGFARAISDGIYRATVWDVVIHPDYQGAGLGRKLVQTLLSHPHMSRVERVYLMTTHQQSFYERIGFKPNTSTTMVLLNQRQEGLDDLLAAGYSTSGVTRGMEH